MQFQRVMYGKIECIVFEQDSIVYINLSKFKLRHDNIYNFLNSTKGKMIVHEFKYKNGLETEPWDTYRKTVWINMARHEYKIIYKLKKCANEYRGVYVREELAIRILKYINAEVASEIEKGFIAWRPSI